MGEDIPFTTFVDLPGIDPGDQVTITPIVEHVGFDLLDKVWVDCNSSDRGSDDSFDSGDDEARPVFRRLLQRTVILLIVTGSQEEPIKIAQAPLPVPALAPTPVI